MLAALLVVPLVPLAARAQEHPSPLGSLDRVAARAAIEAWLVQSGLSPQLEVHALQWRAQAHDPTARWLVLELNFNGGESGNLEAMASAQSLMARFLARTGTPLPDALQYRLVHASGLPRAFVRVTLMLDGENYAVVRNPATGDWQFGPDANRQVRIATALPASARPYSRRIMASAPSATNLAPVGLEAGLAERVQRQLAGYFTRFNAQAKRPAPRLSPMPLEVDYAGLEVAGVRRLVITERDLWEKLQVSIELRADSQGARAVCYLDGSWASGLGTALPNDADYRDMETDYRAQLQRFGQSLLRDLQSGLAAGEATGGSG